MVTQKLLTPVNHVSTRPLRRYSNLFSSDLGRIHYLLNTPAREFIKYQELTDLERIQILLAAVAGNSSELPGAYSINLDHYLREIFNRISAATPAKWRKACNDYAKYGASI